jgi:hypothetical protein
MITYTQPDEHPDSVYPEDCQQGAQFSFLVGATTPITDIGADPTTRAPEDEGLALRVRAQSQVAVQMHYVNTTDRPILKEAWINAIYTPEDEVRQLAGPVTWIGGLGMAIPPKSTVVVSAGGEQCPGWDEPRRVVELVGHAHSNTVRISAFVDRGGSGQRELIYETYDWQDPGFLRFNSIVKNGAPDRRTTTVGGYSGTLMIAPEDRISWECEVQNQWDGVTLRFANEAYTGEMCNVFGVYTPAVESTPWRCFTL